LSPTTDYFPEIDALNLKSWELRYTQTVQALNLAERAHSIALENRYMRGQAYARLHMGICFFLLSRFDESQIEPLHESLHYFESVQDYSGEAKVMNCLANVFDGYGSYEKGLEYCLKGIKLAQGQDLEVLSDLLSTSGNIYSRLSDFEGALAAYKESLRLREDAGNLKAVASSLNLIARTFVSQKDFENGLEYYKKSIELRERLEDTGALPWSFLGLASLYEKKNDAELALVYYAKCMSLNKSRDKRLDLHCLTGIGRYQIQLKNTGKGISDLLKAREIALELNARPMLFEVDALLADLYEMAGDTEKALHYYRSYHKVKEDVLNMESANRLKNQQIGFAMERSEQEAEIHRLKHVELKNAYDEIEEKNNDILASITYALRIQQALLPRPHAIKECLPDSFILFMPKDIVSGDFYWFEQRPESATVYLAIADCTGHGVPGAFMSMLGIEKLREAIAEAEGVSEILAKLNLKMKRSLGQQGGEGETRDGMDIALLALSESKANSHVLLTYAAANRPMWILRKGCQEFMEIKATKSAIGGYTSDEQTFECHSLELQKGDTIYIFSDGYVDQFGYSGKKYLSRRFKELILESAKLPMEEQKMKLEESLQLWMKGVEQTDDILVAGIRI
jgi:serine phosphatase RsbU (regulator of sigma subunit)